MVQRERAMAMEKGKEKAETSSADELLLLRCSPGSSQGARESGGVRDRGEKPLHDVGGDCTEWLKQHVARTIPPEQRKAMRRNAIMRQRAAEREKICNQLQKIPGSRVADLGLLKVRSNGISVYRHACNQNLALLTSSTMRREDKNTEKSLAAVVLQGCCRRRIQPFPLQHRHSEISGINLYPQPKRLPLNRLDSILRIQNLVKRRIETRRIFLEKERSCAAKTIQTWMRRCFALHECNAKREVQNFNAAVRRIQIAFKCFLARRCYKSLRAHKSKDLLSPKERPDILGHDSDVEQKPQISDEKSIAEESRLQCDEVCHADVASDVTETVDTCNQPTRHGSSSQAISSYSPAIDVSGISVERLFQEIDQKLQVTPNSAPPQTLRLTLFSFSDPDVQRVAEAQCAMRQEIRFQRFLESNHLKSHSAEWRQAALQRLRAVRKLKELKEQRLQQIRQEKQELEEELQNLSLE
eukprot:765325-Hanusia_phi.AAC.2